MGKSSLMIRTEQRLQNEGIRSAIVDLTVTGTVESEDQWYKGILTQIARRLRLTIDPVSWWEEEKDIPNIQKFIEFFEEALSEVKEYVVIFMDEIDTTLKLDFRDNFFAGIRAIFNARAENHDLKRITFVLLGVASPSDLIKDRNRTPFNIGQEIPLRPFSREDVRMLEKGLDEAYPKSGQKILDRIFYWTNGHPYLTQKLCQSVVEQHLDEYNDDEIDGLVERLFISEEASRETNLQFVRENILSYPERKVILSLYRKLLRSVEVRDSKNSLPQNHLKLSGLARVDDGKLIVSNRIYGKVFDQRWVNKYTEVDWRYLIISVLSLVIIGFSFVFYNDGVRLPNQAATRVNGIPIYRDDRGIKYLAELFRMKPYIFPNEYEYKAKDTFFNTFSIWEDQKALMDITDDYSKPSREDYEIVVAGLYTSLADVDRSGQTTKLLEVMYKSLKEMGMQNEVVYQEIGYWLEARKSASESNFQDALDNYTGAINLNSQNPATLFERARTYTQLGDFESALKDYEQVIAIVPDFEPTEVPTSAASIRTTETLITLSTSTSPATSTFTPPRTMTLTPVTQLTTPSTVTPSEPRPTVTLANLTPTLSVEPISTQTPTITPIPPPIQPRFLTRGQRIAAVSNDIINNENLSSFLSQVNRANYPNLDASSLIPIVTPTSLVLQQNTSTSSSETAITPTETTEYALQFDGVDDFVSITDTGDFDFNNNFSVEAWVKPLSFAFADSDVFVLGAIVEGALSEPPPSGHGWALFFDRNNSPAWGLTVCVPECNSAQSGGGNLQLNKWQYIAATYDGTNIVVYRDGEKISNTAWSGNVSDVNFILLGRGWSTTFDGLIDEVRIWDITLTQSQIQANMSHRIIGSESGLVGYWIFNEGNGQIVFDSSNRNNNGRLGSSSLSDDNDPIWATSDVPIK